MEFTLKQWRRLKGYNQTELGEMIGRDTQTISNWETGKSEPRVSDLEKIRKALSLRPEDVILMK